MIKPELPIYFLSFLLVMSMGLCSCKHINDGHEGDFTTEGCLIEHDSVSPVKGYPIQLFLETSGSMFGFMSGNNKTEFQTNLWNTITALKDIPGSSLKLFQIRSKDEPIHGWTSDQFRTQLNSGLFQSAKSTDIPQMIDSILRRTARQGVSILVSDLIFSPEDGSPALLDQITPDIRTRFIEKGYAVTIIQKTSEFYRRHGELVAGSPYYYWLIGPRGQVAETIRYIRSSLGVYNEISFGLEPKQLDYSILPFSVPVETALPLACSSTGLYHVYSNWDGSETPIKFDVGANFQPLAVNLADTAYLRANIVIESGDARVTLNKVTPLGSITNQTDKQVAQKVGATHELTFSVSNIQSDNAYFTVNIRRLRPSWINYYNQETDDNLRTKTCGLKKMIDGLDQAYHPNSVLLPQPMKFLITKTSN